MEKIKRLFNKEFSIISEAAIVLGIFTFLSQILGIFRDRLLAGNIGAGEALDIYYASFRIPDLLFTLGASFISVAILMPFLKKKLDDSYKEGKKFLDDIFTIFFVFIIIASAILFILLPMITEKLFPGFDGETLKEVILLSRIMLLSPLLLGISNLFATITQSFKKFFVYALSPVFYNLGIIVGILFFYPLFGITGLAYGVILGAFLHVFIQLPVVLKQNLLPKFSFTISWGDIKEVIYHSLPRTLTLSMSKIVFLVFVSLASLVSSGAISIFNLSYNLQSVPLSIIGVSYSVAAFPVLVDFFNNQNYEKFISHVMIPIRQIIFWSLPIITLFVVLRAQIVRVILGAGNFTWADTRLTAASLALFILSVAAQSIILLLIRAYYASGKTWKPLWITLSSSVITVILAFIFVRIFNALTPFQIFIEKLLRIEGVAGSSVVMLSLAFSVGMFINLYWLWKSFRKDFIFFKNYGIKKTLRESFLSSLIIGGITYLVLNLTDALFNSSKTLGVFFHGFFAGVIGILIGVLFLIFIKNKEFLSFLGALERKFWKRKVLYQDNLEI